MKEYKPMLVRLLAGGLLGALLAPAVVYLIGPMWVAAEAGAAETVGSLWAARPVPVPVAPAMAAAFGSPALALLVQSLLGALFGAVAALSTLPFAEGGRELVLRSLAHFAATAAAFSLLLGVCRWVDGPQYILLWVFLLAVLYALIWLGRWVGWYVEVVQLRSLLGLDPGPSPLKWRETAPYLPFLLLACLLLPAGLTWLDRHVTIDVPVLSQLIYPFVFLPVSGFLSGLSLGKRQGVCPLYPAACGLLTALAALPLGLSPACALCMALPALAGNTAGFLYRRAVPKP